MSDSFSEVTSQSWFSRLGNAIKGVLLGIILFVVAFPLLWWNEGRAVKTAKGLKEAGGAVVSVSADKVDPAHDQQLVHLTAEAATEETLSDADLTAALGRSGTRPVTGGVAEANQGGREQALPAQRPEDVGRRSGQT